MMDLAADTAAPEGATLVAPSGRRHRKRTSEQVLRLRVQELYLQPDATTSAATAKDLMNDTCCGQRRSRGPSTIANDRCWCGKKYPCLDH